MQTPSSPELPPAPEHPETSGAASFLQRLQHWRETDRDALLKEGEDDPFENVRQHDQGRDLE